MTSTRRINEMYGRFQGSARAQQSVVNGRNSTLPEAFSGPA